MKTLWIAFWAFFAFQLQAANVGDTVANFCGTNAQGEEVCLDDFEGVRVLIFNAGWCAPCNSHMSSLVPQVSLYKNKDVTFLSLSVDGWFQGSGATSSFLNQWKNKFNIPFPALGVTWREMSQVFAPPHQIPADAVLDGDRVLRYKAIGSGIGSLFNAINKVIEE